MKIVESFNPPEENHDQIGYPFWEWLDGKIRVATYGEDFKCTAQTFAQHIKRYAKNNGYFCKVKCFGASVMFQLTKP